jgi:hypothetical protein
MVGIVGTALGGGDGVDHARDGVAPEAEDPGAAQLQEEGHPGAMEDVGAGGEQGSPGGGTRKGKGGTRFVKRAELAVVKRQIDSYTRLRALVNRWIDLATELADLKVAEHRKSLDS